MYSPLRLISTETFRYNHSYFHFINLLYDKLNLKNNAISKLTNFKDRPILSFLSYSKEEKSLFPALEQAGMPTKMGPIAMMLIDHQRSREIGNEMENSAKEYLSSGNSEKLISDMQLYVDHITEHLWKENNKLFMMAEARLQHVSKKVDEELSGIEKSQLDELGKSRKHYEELAENLTRDVSNQGN